MIKSLDVYLWSRKVGSLVAYTERYTEKACFYFDRQFLGLNLDIAPLRASIKDEGVANGMPVYAEIDKSFGGLPSFIADSLPDFWGNKVFDMWAGANHLRMRDISSLDRLAYIGRRAMGALEFVPPAAAEMDSPFRVRITDLHKLSQYALGEAKSFNGKVGNGIMVQSLFKVGTSAGGRRPKAIINVNLDTMDCYSGQVASPVPGFTPMIIKFDEHNGVPTTRIEYCYYLMAKAVGINMKPSQMVHDGGFVHFMTERFDRVGDERVHVQTLAAMNPLSDSYESLFEVAVALKLNCAERQQLFLQMVMNVLGANVDDHNKNFSFVMAKDGVWHAAPAYDFTFAVDTSAPWYQNCHSMTINGKNRQVSRADLLAIAKAYNVKIADALIDKACSVVSDFARYAVEAGLDESWIDKIKQEIEDRMEGIR
jgi:serine/threonine-protein kinase HipA